MNEDIVLHLPWPPTVNSYYKVTRHGQRYLDKKVRAFRAVGDEAMNEQAPGLVLDDRYSLRFICSHLIKEKEIWITI